MLEPASKKFFKLLMLGEDMPFTTAEIIVLLAILWTLPWKGIALWKSARNKQTAWFVILFLVNTLAILEILYLIFWQGGKKR